MGRVGDIGGSSPAAAPSASSSSSSTSCREVMLAPVVGSMALGGGGGVASTGSIDNSRSELAGDGGAMFAELDMEAATTGESGSNTSASSIWLLSPRRGTVCGIEIGERVARMYSARGSRSSGGKGSSVSSSGGTPRAPLIRSQISSVRGKIHCLALRTQVASSTSSLGTFLNQFSSSAYVQSLGSLSGLGIFASGTTLAGARASGGKVCERRANSLAVGEVEIREATSPGRSINGR